MHPIEAGHALGGEQQIKNESEIDDLFTTVNVTLIWKKRSVERNIGGKFFPKRHERHEWRDQLTEKLKRWKKKN